MKTCFLKFDVYYFKQQYTLYNIPTIMTFLNLINNFRAMAKYSGSKLLNKRKLLADLMKLFIYFLQI